MDELRHQPHVVADEDHGRAELLLDAPQRVHHLLLNDHVERRGRLVGDDHARLQADGYRDAHALFHSAGQLVRVHLADLRPQTDLLEQIGNPSGPVPLA